MHHLPKVVAMMSDPVDRVARALYDARRPHYVPPWPDVDDGHAMKQGCLQDARIALAAIEAPITEGGEIQ